MKYMIFADPHWSAYSSIVRGRGEKYSLRLENLLNTMSWLESTAVEQNCECIICLGDFFDKAELNSEEITALQEIKWSHLKHIFLVGNHEMGRSNLQFSSSHIFKLCPNVTVIDKPTTMCTFNSELCFIPYVLEDDRKPLKEYLSSADASRRIILSHNDIKGMQLGKFTSADGFSIEEIEQNCRLFINGHLHNGTWVGKNICNLGNITGQNFSEDALQYRHEALILDDEACSLDWIENPYAFNFYKLDVAAYKDAKTIQSVLLKCKCNSVITIKVNNDAHTLVSELIADMPNIVASRIIIEKSTTSVVGVDTSVAVEINGVDHITKFTEYVKEYLGTDKEILEELSRVVAL